MFDAIVCITLPRRADRWKAFQERFPADWPFRPVIPFPGTDGQLCPRPKWWFESTGAWGCYRSHYRILERCLNAGYKSVLVFEDDALFPENVVGELKSFLSHLPDDWQMIYLGGQLLRDSFRPPTRVNNWVYRPYNVNRMHAYAIRGVPMLQAVYEHVSSRDWFERHHIDHHLGRMHQTGEFKVYVPKRWLVGQLGGASDITNEPSATMFWEHPEDVAARPLERFVAVLGLHESYASRVALALHRLGVHMGDNLGDDATMQDAQDPWLTRHGEWAAPFPSNRIVVREDALRDRVEDWLGHHMWRARISNKLGGAKHPYLSLFGNYLRDCCGERLRVIDVREDIGELTGKLDERIRQQPTHNGSSSAQAQGLQTWLLNEKENFVASVPHLALGRTYMEQNAGIAVKQICEYLQLRPSPEQLAGAVRALQPS